MENKKIAICGDSFSIGIGCHNLQTEPYGQLLGKELSKEVINLSKGSSTNLSIFLQAEYVARELKDQVDLVLVSNTSYDRINWFPVGYEHMKPELTNVDVNYHQYPPYGPHSYHQLIQSPYENNTSYTGKMFTENIRGVIDYWENFRSKDKESGYYYRFKKEPKERMKLIYEHSIDVFESRISRIECIGVLTMAHQLLKKVGLNHLILTQEVDEYAKYMNIENLVYVSWGELSVKYPDDIPTLHTSPQGHRIAALSVLEKLKENNWV